MSATSFIARPDEVRAGVIVPCDMALDSELRRWVPDGVSLLFTRTPIAASTADVVSDEAVIERCTSALRSAGPVAYAYAGTTGSLIHGMAGEKRLVEMIRSVGGTDAVTTSGALLTGLKRLSIRRVATAAPYDTDVTERLAAFLREADIEVESSAHLGLNGEAWTVPYDQTIQLVREADSGEAEAVFIASTNLATYDIIAPLEAELGKPVISANQVTMWALLRSMDRSAVGPHQWLLHGPGTPDD